VKGSPKIDPSCPPGLQQLQQGVREGNGGGQTHPQLLLRLQEGGVVRGPCPAYAPAYHHLLTCSSSSSSMANSSSRVGRPQMSLPTRHMPGVVLMTVPLSPPPQAVLSQQQPQGLTRTMYVSL
jgi:hypothetical protein